MSEAILVALITGGISLIGTILTILFKLNDIVSYQPVAGCKCKIDSVSCL